MLLYLFGAVLGLICVYTLRHYCFTLNRSLGVQHHPYIDLASADWPAVTILIAAHNEEKVVSDILTALLQVDYPENRLHIIPVNDRSADRTREIIDSFVERYPNRISPFHRTSGKPGKAAALKDAMVMVKTEVFLVFDADYVPGQALIRQLVAPFFDPEVGSVMGRVVPLNVGRKLLTRLLDLERSGGYQVDQQARKSKLLDVTSIKAPSEALKAAGYFELPVKIVMKGDFRSFYDFLLQIERLARITRINQMKLTKINEVDGSMTADMTLSIFFAPDTAD
jgi:cellulose synthase/poly-beta-1,6-N-acetylglucosamine synthase-like glycosyltransferase